jgi:hypothetical protein
MLSRTMAVLAFVTLAGACSSASADEGSRSCPKNLMLNGTNHALDKVTVYNGSPSDDAELLPDVNGWNLEDYAQSGHELYLVCKYKGTDQVARYIIPRTMKSCKPLISNIVCR